jgi:uncharacterized protein
LLKIASRCNLNCDYCYVYQHADQSWRGQPRFMTDETLLRFAERLREYIELHDCREFSITFHGGEPLLYGAERIAAAAEMIRRAVGKRCALDFSLQSNGTLLFDDSIACLESANIGVSLSLDGPQQANDLHRLDHRGQSSFSESVAAISRLQQRRSPIFRGVLAVIDPRISPRTLFEFFSRLGVPRLDLLLPDATYERQPPGRVLNVKLYADWLRDALSVWTAEFSELPVRWFDALLASRLGVPSPTDAMGLGAVSLLVVDTDGSYSDHDVFKITASGGGALCRSLNEVSFEEISTHPVLREHGFRLTINGLSQKCRHCPVVEACAGGSVMHRWHPTLKFNAPSVYCPELFATLETATQLVRNGLIGGSTGKIARALVGWDEGERFTAECIRWRSETEARATAAASRLGVKRNGESAASILLCERHKAVQQLLGEPHGRKAERWLDTIAVQPGDQRLVAPFQDTIRVLPQESSQVREAIVTLQRVSALFAAWDANLPTAFAALISDIVFVESTDGTSDRIFSFSDDTAPNVLYISPSVGGAPLEADDLGDSLLHEFLHQVLYQMERDSPMLLDHVYPRFPAPWREGLRPAGGFLHGTFVFAGLSQYWTALAHVRPTGLRPEKAVENATRFSKQAIFGIQSLRQFGLLTKRGASLLDQLAEKLGPNAMQHMAAPGLNPLP